MYEFGKYGEDGSGGKYVYRIPMTPATSTIRVLLNIPVEKTVLVTAPMTR